MHMLGTIIVFSIKAGVLLCAAMTAFSLVFSMSVWLYVLVFGRNKGRK